ncbi:MAG: choice-of-anchor A family protein, partial [Cyanobacteria bacterium J06559_3]
LVKPFLGQYFKLLSCTERYAKYYGHFLHDNFWFPTTCNNCSGFASGDRGGISAAEAASYSLGKAADFNVVILGDYTLTNTDVEGKLAVGGTFTANTFGVGSKLRGDHGDTLVVGGDINLSNGKVYGDAVYGGSATVTTDAGFEFRASDNTIIRKSNLRRGTPIDFTSLGQSVKHLAANIAHKAAGLNYSQTVEPMAGGIATTIANATTNILYIQYDDDVTLAKFVGTNASENVFNIETGALDTLKKLTFDVPETAKVIINVEGESVDLSEFGIFFGDQDCNPGATNTVHFWCRDRSRNILFNFEQASTLSISEVGFMGSILAPNAQVDFNNGHINGTLIADNLSGTGESHLHLFNSDTPAMPLSPSELPEPVTFLGLGLLGLGMVKLKRNT